MLYHDHQCRGRLADHVKGIVYYRDYQPQHSRDKLLPDGTTNLVLDLTESPKYIYDNSTLAVRQTCREAWFSGMLTRFITISSGRDAQMVVLTFRTGAAYPFVHQSLKRYQDEVVAAVDVFGQEIQQLRSALITAATPEAICQQLEHWLEARLIEPTGPQHTVRHCVQEIASTYDQLRVGEMAQRSGYSQKQLIHLFNTYVGLTPKQLHRINRFNGILERVYSHQQVDWAATAAVCGYFDQAHFIRDFQAFSGLNPRDYLQQQGEWAHYVPVESRQHD